jgi:hypothetical protein
MARVARADAALKKKVPKPVTVVVVEPPKPIENILLDRITTYDQLKNFIRGQGALNSEAFLRGQVSEFDLAYRHVLLHVHARSDMRPYGDYLALFYKGWQTETCSNSGGHCEPTDASWRHFRDLLRFTNQTWMATNAWRGLKSATELNQIDYDGATSPRGRWRLPPYLRTLFDDYGVKVDPRHYLHISPKDPAMVRFFPDERAQAKDVLVETTITKYVRRFFPDISDTRLQDIALLHKTTVLEDGVEFFTSPEDILNVYDHGPASCMGGKAANWFGGHTHPTAAYANCDGVKLAAIRNGPGTFSARGFVIENDKKKVFIRCYGDERGLVARLSKRGFVKGNWDGVKLKKIQALDKNGEPIPRTWIGPYLDDMVVGNGVGGVQYAATCDEWDYFVAGQHSALQRLVENKAGAQIVDCSATRGLWGDYVQYHPIRHRFWRAMMEGRRYTSPVYETFNEAGEILCRHCSEPSEREHVRPLLDDHWMCATCVDAMLPAELVAVEDETRDGHQVLARLHQVVALPRDEDQDEALTTDQLCDRRPRDRRAEKYMFVPSHSIEAYGYIFLAPCEGGGLVKQSDAFVYHDVDGWLRRENIVATVNGMTAHKKRAWFMGQNFSEQIQYFSPVEKEVRVALSQGHFFVLGSKIEYDASSRFTPIKRRDFFEAVGELDEEEDDEIQDLSGFVERVPLVDFLSILWADLAIRFHKTTNRTADRGYLVDMLYGRVSNLWPRVHQDFAWFLVDAFSRLTDNPHAGIDGINRISARVQHALTENAVL